MRLGTTFKLIFIVALAAFLYGGYIFNEDRWGKKWQPADAILPDNVKYYGEIINGLLEGPGELQGADGRRFKGSFQSGLMEGQGEYQDLHMRYEGGFSRGMFNGKGELVYTNGMKYSGEFKDNRMHGQGELTWTNGNSFTGLFNDDAMTKGIFKEAEGAVYDGEFFDTLYHGKGVFVSADGDRYEGDFVKGALTGKGIINRAESGHYEGEVEDWSYHGQGTLTDESGNIYTGAFEHGVYHGYGELQFKEPVEGLDILKGEWTYGYLEEDPRVVRADPAPIVEKILYSQGSLLDNSAELLTDQTPGKIDFYFLGVAGDGTQEVFYRELQFIQNLLGESLQTTQRQWLLVNNRQTTEQYPLATTTALTKAVTSLRQKMDVEEDILLVYLTSHGTEDHQFYLAMPGLELPAVGKKDLAKILGDSGSQWRIVIVSACYAGGFIPELQNEQTLVITAAREDRKSFGCDDRNDMTYFARAYFKESFAQNPDFIAAFDSAKTLVEKWEDEDFPEDEHSEPQIFIGEKIRAHLQTWAAQRGASGQMVPHP
jgi:hypothetical protein